MKNISYHMEFFSKSNPRLISDDMIQHIHEALNINNINNAQINAQLIPSNIALNNLYENFILPNMFFFILFFMIMLFLYAQYITTINEKIKDKKKQAKIKKNKELQIKKEKEEENILINLEKKSLSFDVNSFIKDNEDVLEVHNDEQITGKPLWTNAFTEPMNTNMDNLWYGESYNQTGLNNATSLIFS